MSAALHSLDWAVIGLYLLGILAMAAVLARGQHSREDYFVGGRGVGAWPVALSIMATQCSTNSILGAPAFVAFAAGGGLIWLQYELAVPLAMIFIMLAMMPRLRRLKLVSVYGYLETRFDRRTRLVLSGLFMLVRAFATAVTVYSVALVVDLITGFGFVTSVLILGAFTALYDVLGGIRGVIYSDVLQLLILTVVLLLLLVSLAADAGGFTEMFSEFAPERRRGLNFYEWGISGGSAFGFWPMLFGGFFLYVSYYGCDQSQVQRTLSTASTDESNRALMLNGLLRFPLVALYCLVGVGIGVYSASHPEFLSALMGQGESGQINLAVPAYMLQALPSGLVGLGLVALFAAAMSSLDSVINALSASTMEDFIRPLRRKPWSDTFELWICRAVTVFWGASTVALSFYVGDIAPTVLEAINKIGSLANGPVLAVFLLGFFSSRVSGNSAIAGLVTGMGVNALCWLTLPSLSWLWWNPLGCTVTATVALMITALAGTSTHGPDAIAGPSLGKEGDPHSNPALWRRWSLGLAAWFALLLVTLSLT